MNVSCVRSAYSDLSRTRAQTPDLLLTSPKFLPETPEFKPFWIFLTQRQRRLLCTPLYNYQIFKKDRKRENNVFLNRIFQATGRNRTSNKRKLLQLVCKLGFGLTFDYSFMTSRPCKECGSFSNNLKADLPMSQMMTYGKTLFMNLLAVHQRAERRILAASRF